MDIEIDKKEEEDNLSNEERTLLLNGYRKEKYMADTLQGHVILATRKRKRNGDGEGEGEQDNEQQDKKTVVIKTSNKVLHSQHITLQKNGKRYKIEEDIIKEAKLMKDFMDSPHPSCLIEYYDFFEDKENYYLVMENGGSDLFDFVVECHKLVLSKKISIREWRKHCKFMFAQMVLFIGWMHKIKHCCNLDISLENMLICHEANINIQNEEEFKLNKCYIKFIDFGLSEYFDPIMNPCFLCNKFVGKQRYKAPEVYAAKSTFIGNKADIWSLGVVLFMMIVGSPPYDKPNDKDIAFKYIQAERISDLLQSWNRLNYLTANLLDLLTKMLCVDPTKRLNIQQVMKHPWLKIYFPSKNKDNNNNDNNNNHDKNSKRKSFKMGANISV